VEGVVEGEVVISVLKLWRVVDLILRNVEWESMCYRRKLQRYRRVSVLV
jgi:hypothetical protein